MPHRPIVVLIQQLEAIEATFDPAQLESLLQFAMAYRLCDPDEVSKVLAARRQGLAYRDIRVQQEAH